MILSRAICADNLRERERERETDLCREAMREKGNLAWLIGRIMSLTRFDDSIDSPPSGGPFASSPSSSHAQSHRAGGFSILATTSGPRCDDGMSRKRIVALESNSRSDSRSRDNARTKTHVRVQVRKRERERSHRNHDSRTPPGAIKRLSAVRKVHHEPSDCSLIACRDRGSITSSERFRNCITPALHLVSHALHAASPMFQPA